MTPARPYLANPPLALAHRGGALYRPNVGLENTLTAFGHAVDLGYTHLETDVRLTRDGHLIAFHDDRLDRVSDRTGMIRDLSWAEISRARLRGSERVPLLTEIFDAFPGVRVNIDLKAAGTAAAAWRAITDHGLHDRVCVASFSRRRLGQFRHLSRGTVATAAGHVGVALLRFSPRWVSRALRTPADVLQIPPVVPLGGRRRLVLVDQRLVDTAHAHGKQVHVWTVDDPAEMHRLLDLGVDGLVSDRIDVLRDVLVERGVWTGRR